MLLLFLFMVVIIVQVLFAIHVVRSGHDRYWIFIILLFPGVGCLMYFTMAMIPAMLRSRGMKKFISAVKYKLNPKRKLKQLQEELVISETSQNYLAIADEYYHLRQYREAAEHYLKALCGIFASDKEIMCRLARAQYLAGELQECVKTTDKIKSEHPLFKSQEIHLLCARALAGSGETIRAEQEYICLTEYYSGPQARYYYALTLASQSKYSDAIAQLESVMLTAKRSKPHYRKYHKQTLRLAETYLKVLRKKEPSVK